MRVLVAIMTVWVVVDACAPSKKFSSQKAYSQQTVAYHPLRDTSDLNVLLDNLDDARIVLLGESTHGTHEFYEWRSAITKKLVCEKGFNAIAVEGDWADCYDVNNFVSGPARDSLATQALLREFHRWPASLWGNYEMVSFVTWLNQYNQSRPVVGFYGLDVYGFWEFPRTNKIPAALERAFTQFADNFSRYSGDALKYTSDVRHLGLNYGAAVDNFRSKVDDYLKDKGKSAENMLLQQEAALAVDGEKYFRSMVTDKVGSWNTRDSHMAETVKRLLAFYGDSSKIVIWVHNSHAGDVKYSQMNEAGYSSLGQILKKTYGDDRVFSVGFGTNKGSVTAGVNWNGPIKQINVPEAMPGSWENILHGLSDSNKIVLSSEIRSNDPLNQSVWFRSIGAAFSDNAVYGTAVVPKRFDAFVYIDSTTASRPLK